MKVIPFGDRILVRRKTVGEKLGSGVLYAPEQTADRPTDLAEVVYIPDHTFGDSEILQNSVEIIKALVEKSKAGDSEALIALLRLNEYIKIKGIAVGDTIMLSRYVGITFMSKESNQEMTLVNSSDIIGIVKP